MKLTSLMIALTISAVAGFGALASDKEGKQTEKRVSGKSKTQLQAPQREKQVALTGSYIKRDIRRNGVVTDGPNPVLVIDEQAIRNSGAADLRQLLVRKGVNR